MIYFGVFAALKVTGNQQFDALTVSNIVPMYPEFKSKFLPRRAAETPHGLTLRR